MPNISSLYLCNSANFGLSFILKNLFHVTFQTPPLSHFENCFPESRLLFISKIVLNNISRFPVLINGFASPPGLNYQMQGAQLWPPLPTFDRGELRGV